MLKCLKFQILFLTVIFALFGSNFAERKEDPRKLSRFEDDRSRSCVENCGSKLIETLGSYASQVGVYPMSETASPPLCSSLTPDSLDSVCALHNNASACVKACRDGTMKKTFSMAGGIFEFMCATRYKDFKKNLPCINSACGEVVSACNPKCQKFQNDIAEAVESSQNVDILMDRKAMADLSQKIYSAGCLYTGCQVDCSTPILTKKCSADVAKLPRELVYKAMTLAQAFMQQMMQTKMEVPKSCVNLQENLDPGRPGARPRRCVGC